VPPTKGQQLLFKGPRGATRSQIDHSVIAITATETVCRHVAHIKDGSETSGHLKGEMDMHTLAFAIAVASAKAFLTDLPPVHRILPTGFGAVAFPRMLMTTLAPAEAQSLSVEK
jgi:hypothetical protein